MALTVTDRTPPSSLKAVAMAASLAGIAYLLVPIFALRPDGELAVHPQMWVHVIASPFLGLSIIGASALVIRRYNSVTLALWWAVLIIGNLYGPYAFAMVNHYGK